jgi:hypothetical protein
MISNMSQKMIILCSNGDSQSSSYKSTENHFLQHLVYVIKRGQIPDGTVVKTFSKPNSPLPNPNGQESFKAFIIVLLNLMGINPWVSNVSWEAELYKEFGYTFLVFLLTGNF